MSDKPMEERHLALANTHIMLAEKNIAEQEARIKRRAAKGQDTTKLEKTLLIFKQTLEAMYTHRAEILAVLDDESAS
jgi:hypothetical protein